MNKKDRSINLNWSILLLQKILNLIDILTEALVILCLVVITSPVLQLPLNYVFISLPIGVVLALLSRLRKVWNYIHEVRTSGMSQTKHTPTPNFEQIEYPNRLEEE